MEFAKAASQKIDPASAKAPGRGKYDRTQSKAQRRQAQLETLLEATGEVIAVEGYGGTTVAAICEKAGMSRRTFYQHFDGTKDAMLELHDFCATFAFEYVAERVLAEIHPIDQLRVGVTAFLGLIAEHADMARVVFREIRSVGPQYEIRREQEIEKFVALIMAGVERAHDEGVIEEPADDVTVYALVAAMEAVALRYVFRGEAEKAIEAQDKMIEMVFRIFRYNPSA